MAKILANRQIKILSRYMGILFGMFLMANGIVFLVQARLGVSPWDVLHLGISYQTDISLGRVLQGVGLILIAVSFVFGVKPRFVTLLNMFFVGFFVDKITNLGYVPPPEPVWAKFAMYLTGVFICGIGTALYISGNRGAGPRDSLMLALMKATSLRIGIVRTLIEATVAVAGYFLGGPLGVGTLLFVLLMGWSVEIGFAVINHLKKSRFFRLWWVGAGEYPAFMKN